MIDLSKIENIYLYTGSTDLRKSINGLSILINETFEISDLRNKIFIFCSKTKTNLKILEYDYDGFWLYQKRLSGGKFIWPKENGKVLIDKRQLMWLLDGLSIVQKTAHIQKEINCLY